MRPTAGRVRDRLRALFDLVYVFALTQVTGYVVHEHSAEGALPGPLDARAAVVDVCAYTWSATRRAPTRPAARRHGPGDGRDVRGRADDPRGGTTPRADSTGRSCWCVAISWSAACTSRSTAWRRETTKAAPPDRILRGSGWRSAAAAADRRLVGGWAQTALFGAARRSTGRAPTSARVTAAGACTARFMDQRHGLFVILATRVDRGHRVGAPSRPSAPPVAAAALGVAAATLSVAVLRRGLAGRRAAGPRDHGRRTRADGARGLHYATSRSWRASSLPRSASRAARTRGRDQGPRGLLRAAALRRLRALPGGARLLQAARPRQCEPRAPVAVAVLLADIPAGIAARRWRRWPVSCSSSGC